jgi:hypothetical protein
MDEWCGHTYGEADGRFLLSMGVCVGCSGKALHVCAIRAAPSMEAGVGEREGKGRHCTQYSRGLDPMQYIDAKY